MMDIQKGYCGAIVDNGISRLALSNYPHYPDQHTNSKPHSAVSYFLYMDNNIINIDGKSALSQIIPHGIIPLYQVG